MNPRLLDSDTIFCMTLVSLSLKKGLLDEGSDSGAESLYSGNRLELAPILGSSAPIRKMTRTVDSEGEIPYTSGPEEAR